LYRKSSILSKQASDSASYPSSNSFGAGTGPFFCDALTSFVALSAFYQPSSRRRWTHFQS